ncbi:unnamed protein product (macronuclear) [Paramecium tetraurelia]|uniref:Uncharacterized protein n=1 Tax=Paramecium tetraurelia TaxID=5888 RepID=A0CW67_PARTE|nr:uncharacterized protein GSPATT00001236001 [Paramecium tetraurelia]CAK75034.1 unnamed protein product [Paramecium tetraurelia]|eukprot:XP_001442431.1 hypothetical protein (macronuclear) [Paramecium tetraurelia strain d4-2]
MSQSNPSHNYYSQGVSDKFKPPFNQKLLKEKINELQNAIQRTEKEYNQANQISDKTNSKAKQSLNSFDRTQNQKDSQIENLIVENQILVKAIQKLETKVKNQVQLQNENQTLKQNVEDIKSENELLKQKKTLKNDSKLSSDAALGILAAKRSQEIQILTNEVKETKQKNQNLQGKLDKLILENQHLQSIIKNSENQQLRSDSQNNSIKKNNFVEKHSDQNQTKQNEQIFQLQLELDDAKKTITQLQKLNKANHYTQQSSNYKFSNSNDKISKSQSLEPSHFDKDKRMKELEEKIKKLQFEKDSQLYTTKLECAQDLKQFQEKLKQEYNQKQQFENDYDKPTQDKVKKLSAENTKFQIMLERQNKEIMNMERKFTELLMQKEELQQNLLKEQQFQGYLKQEKSLLQNSLKEKDKEISELKDDIIKLSKERQQLKDQIEKLKFEVKMSQIKSSNRPQSHQSETSKRNR